MHMHASERLLRTRPTFSETVMVSVGVSKLGCTELFFVEPGLKLNLFIPRRLTVLQHTVLVKQLSSYIERRAGLYFTGTVATEQYRS